ncbi:MAG: hypothetical protein R2734_08320 [Nocardioides sp.]
MACAYAITDLAAAEDVAQDAYAKAWPRWRLLAAHDDPGQRVGAPGRHAVAICWCRQQTARRFLTRSRLRPAAPVDETTVAVSPAPDPERAAPKAIVLH